MDKQKIVKFIKTHKKEIALTGAAVIGGVVIFAVTKHWSSSYAKFVTDNGEVLSGRAAEDARISSLNWGLGTITDLWNEGDYTNAIVNDITIADIGKLGEELLKDEMIKPDSTVSVVVACSH